MPFKIVNKDITSLKVDALVNSTNYNMYGFSGVDKLIHRLGGPEFEAECEQYRHKLKLGEALYTNAYGDLKCKYVIHTYGCGYITGLQGEPVILKSCYRESLRLADDLGCKTVAFPLINAGTMEYPIEEALGIAISSITEYLNYTRSKLNVTLAIYGASAEAVAGSVLNGLDTYIKKKSGESEIYIGSTPSETEKPYDLDAVISNLGESFPEMLMRLMKERNLSDPQVYGPLLMPRQTFNNIINGKVKTPKRETIIGMALVMRLTLQETSDLLGAAGLKLSDSSVFDMVIEFCIQHEKYDLNLVNTQLVKYGQNPIFAEK